jgi:IMP dehydrogenase
VVNAAGELRGLITVKDIQKKLDYPLASKDDLGRLRVAAAVGVGPDTVLRAELLVEAGVDLIVRRHRPRPQQERDRDGAPA